MANSMTGRQLSIGTTRRTFTDLLGFARPVTFRNMDLRAAESQSGTIYLCLSDGNKFGYLLTGDAYTIPGPVSTDDVAVEASAASQVFYLAAKEQ